MSRVGYIIKKENNLAIVSTSRRGICEGCSDKASCSFDTALGGGVKEDISVRDPIGANPGDMVEFDLIGHTELKISLIVWIFPLLGLLLGATLGFRLHGWLSLSTDIGTLIGAIIGLVVAFVLVMGYEKFFSRKKELIPVIQKIIPDTQCDIKE